MVGTRHRGVALVAVLWIVGLLALLAVTTLSVMRARTRDTAALLESIRAASLRDATVLEVAQRMTGPNPQDRLPVNGTPIALQVLDAEVTVSLQIEGGRVDLNHADDALLSALLIANGLSQDTAADFLAKLRDWQDADEIPRRGGAETTDYHAAGLSYGPRNGPLETVDEIFQLLKVDHAALECLLPALTIYSGGTAANFRFAGDQVKRAIYWADHREWSGHRWLDASAPVPLGSDEPYSGQVLRLEIAMPSIGAKAPAHEIVLRLTGDERMPALVMLDQLSPSRSVMPSNCAKAESVQ